MLAFFAIGVRQLHTGLSLKGVLLLLMPVTGFRAILRGNPKFIMDAT